ncbi:STAS domain-containing protein [Streptomyces aureus]|uniref:STAS domain-containing protein n=1 Tax=Streptomyces aureus TaxID=193461 RepID=UPI0006E23FEE|nr:STAS domain-containing protein [Streptomyces aureus]
MHPLPDHSAAARAPAGDAAIKPPAPGPDAQMTVKTTPDGGIVVSGEIDKATATHLCRSLLDALRAHPEGITLDFGAVTFCDCAGLRALLTARASWVARLEQASPAAPAASRQHLDSGRHPPQPLTLGPVSPRMARLLQLTGTGDLFSPPKPGRPQ